MQNGLYRCSLVRVLRNPMGLASEMDSIANAVFLYTGGWQCMKKKQANKKSNQELMT